MFTHLIILHSFAQETENRISSQIKEVTVFLQGAQVHRTAYAKISEGQSTLVFSGLSTQIQQQSIQVEPSDNTLKILSVSYRVNYIDDGKKTSGNSTLENEKKRIENLVKAEAAQLEVFNEEESLLKANKYIGSQQNGVKVEELKAASDFFRTKLLEIKQKQLQLKLSISSNESEIEKIKAQLRESQAIKTPPTGEVVAVVTSSKPVNCELKLRYTVARARWFPTYDVRAKDVQSPMRITYKANVQQHTQEDWNKVKLTISTGNPYAAGTRPTMQPWHLRFNYPSQNNYGISSGGSIGGRVVQGRVITLENGTAMGGVNVVIKGTTIGTVTDVNGNYSLSVPSDASTIVFSFIGYKTEEVDMRKRSESVININMTQDVAQLYEVVATGVGGEASGMMREREKKPKVVGSLTINDAPDTRSTHVEYNIAEPYTIKSGETNKIVEMIEYESEALYEYYIAPKLDPTAYLTAKITNWDSFNFLEGEANLFFEGKFLGKSLLDTRNVEDTLTVSLGRDANISIKREKIKDYSSSVFLGASRKKTFAYSIEVRNKKPLPVQMIIEDQLPVSDNKEIVVEKIEDSGANHNETTGSLKWASEMKPGETKKIEIKYSIKYPKDSNVILE